MNLCRKRKTKDTGRKNVFHQKIDCRRRDFCLTGECAASGLLYATNFSGPQQKKFVQGRMVRESVGQGIVCACLGALALKFPVVPGKDQGEQGADGVDKEPKFPDIKHSTR